jgi:hypothetical protein
MKSKMMLLTALASLVVLFSLTLAFGAGESRKASSGRELLPVPTATPTAPKFKVVNLACSTGVLNTTVKNSSNMNIPVYATITVHGVQGDCTQTAKGPLAKGKSKAFLGCAEPVTSCKASAKWELGLD